MSHPEVDQGPVVIIREKMTNIENISEGLVPDTLDFLPPRQAEERLCAETYRAVARRSVWRKICCPFIILPFCGPQPTPIVKRLVTKEFLCFIFFLRKALHFGIGEEFGNSVNMGSRRSGLGRSGGSKRSGPFKASTKPGSKAEVWRSDSTACAACAESLASSAISPGSAEKTTPHKKIEHPKQEDPFVAGWASEGSHDFRNILASSWGRRGSRRWPLWHWLSRRRVVELPPPLGSVADGRLVGDEKYGNKSLRVAWPDGGSTSLLVPSKAPSNPPREGFVTTPPPTTLGKTTVSGPLLVEVII